MSGISQKKIVKLLCVRISMYGTTQHVCVLSFHNICSFVLFFFNPTFSNLEGSGNLSPWEMSSHSLFSFCYPVCSIADRHDRMGMRIKSMRVIVAAHCTYMNKIGFHYLSNASDRLNS